MAFAANLVHALESMVVCVGRSGFNFLMYDRQAEQQRMCQLVSENDSSELLRSALESLQVIKPMIFSLLTTVL